MASNLLSRLLPATTGSPSVYETLRQHDESSEASDVEERAGLALDEENLEQRFEAYELDQVEADGLGDSRTASDQDAPFVEEAIQLRRSSSWKRSKPSTKAASRPRWMSSQVSLPAAEEGDDEVPASLLIEGGDAAARALLENHNEPAEGRHLQCPARRTPKPERTGGRHRHVKASIRTIYPRKIGRRRRRSGDPKAWP